MRKTLIENNILASLTYIGNAQAIKVLQLNNMVMGYHECFSMINLCKGYLVGKMPEHQFDKKCQHPIELVHNGSCGHFPTKSISGSEYFISFIDD